MIIYLSGHYSNSFTKEIMGGVILENLEKNMKVYTVNVQSTAGGVISDCISVYKGQSKLREINVEAMKIFLAGGTAGNIRDFWNKAMKVYIAGDNGKKQLLTDRLESNEMLSNDDALKSINVLESYYYLRKNEDFMKLVQYFGSFLLDSGAFTFMSGSHKGAINWDEYLEAYAAFINKYDIKLFFELDIDSVVGLAEVERLRFKLETLTGKKPIPVWHKNRGKDYFVKMCENYPYVAIGGIVTKEIPRNVYEKGFPWFIQTAHKHKAKIHGLGYTTIANLKNFHFDSVDSTAWLYGNRGGYLYKFNPRTGLMEQLSGKDGCRLKSREGAVNNFNEWVKFGKYAEKFL